MTADCVRSGTPDVTDKSSLEEEKPLHFWHEEHSGCNKMPNVNIFNRHSETKLQIILIIIIQITATEPGWMAGCFFSVSGFLVHTHTHTHTHTCWFLWFTGTFHRRNGFYTVQAVCAIALHLPYT